MDIASFTTLAKIVEATYMQLHGYNKWWNGPIGLGADGQEYWIGWEVHQLSGDQIPRISWHQQEWKEPAKN